MIEKIDEAVEWVRTRSDVAPRVGMILGSGLGALVDSIDEKFRCSFRDIPHAPASGVAGHSGDLVLGTARDVPVAVMQGRVHYYEGHSMEDIVFLPRVLARLGIDTAIVTNAAGGANPEYQSGDLMLIRDHINFIGENPLRGPNEDDLGPRFPDMSEAYDHDLREMARGAASEVGLELREGVYVAVSGPSYETPAEIRAFRALGADAVGMSTVPETIALRHMGVKVLGISCITNMAAGILSQLLTHAEVMETTARVQARFAALVLGVLSRIGSTIATRTGSGE